MEYKNLWFEKIITFSHCFRKEFLNGYAILAEYV